LNEQFCFKTRRLKNVSDRTAGETEEYSKHAQQPQEMLGRRDIRKHSEITRPVTRNSAIAEIADRTAYDAYGILATVSVTSLRTASTYNLILPCRVYERTQTLSTQARQTKVKVVHEVSE